MTNITPAAPTVTFLDNPHAPDVFADGWTGFFTFNGNIKITFESVRVNHVTSPRPGIASSDRTVSDAPGGGRGHGKGPVRYRSTTHAGKSAGPNSNQTLKTFLIVALLNRRPVGPVASLR